MIPLWTTKVDGSRSRSLSPAGGLRLLAANVVIGIVAGLAWPFVYIMGHVIAALAGWTVGDPTLTDDGLGIPIGMGAIVIVFIVGTFLALNVPMARRARIPAVRWLPSAVAVTLLASAATAGQFYYH